MQINFVCPYWGCEYLDAEKFFEKVLANGYNGIEINLPPAHTEFTRCFHTLLKQHQISNGNFIFIAQQLLLPSNNSLNRYIKKMEKRLLELAAFSPTFINSHTGKDYFSFDDNCRIIEAALSVSYKTGVRILHETHRGRFSFHAAGLLAYLKKFPEMELVGDFSHFCVVSESMLTDQQKIMDKIIPHIGHIHARIGHEQSPQVNDPSAEEWQNHFMQFVKWWKQVIAEKKKLAWNSISVTPEFGPAPYMPAEPFTQRPLSNQWDNNIYMMSMLKIIFS